MLSGLWNRQLSHSRLRVSERLFKRRNVYKGSAAGETFFIQEKWIKRGTDESDRDVDLDLLCLMFLFLRGLLNCLCRAVGRPERILTTVYLSAFKPEQR